MSENIELPEYLQKIGVKLDWQQVMKVLKPILTDFPLFHTRKEELFLHFLPTGYTYVTVTCINPDVFFNLLINKTKIGMLITLYDDLADHPDRKNPKLLQELYKVPFHENRVDSSSFNDEEKYILNFAQSMWKDILTDIQKFPYYDKFYNFFAFDIQQFYNANLYSEMISAYPEMANQTENRTYLSHNMGMIITGMMDLMATPNGFFAELGAMRHILYNGQMLGRLSNVLITLERELKEGDVTNEICSLALQRMQINVDDLRNKSVIELKTLFQPIIDEMYVERQRLYEEINKVKIKTFCVPSFVKAIKLLHELHASMRGDI
ncbi:hypothetical protein [Candidatus Uabimicrobium sp. HlEnr_7]|uniref:hypothetical protein n=1 Tax=Candidatus Uabimicrobium helgolandensis TaxID=3095367 RepID=UPI003555DBAB